MKIRHLALMLGFIFFICSPSNAITATGIGRTPPKKVYVTWVTVQQPGRPEIRVKGIFKGITDSSLLIETKVPLEGWVEKDGDYEIPVSAISKLAVRRRISPGLAILVGYGSGVVGGLIGGLLVNKALFALVQMFIVAFAIAAGVLIGLLLLFSKKKYTINGDKKLFAAQKESLGKYVPGQD